jgi:hypothetical protein
VETARRKAISVVEVVSGSEYYSAMTKLFDKALEAVRRLPAESQDEVARAILNLVDDDEEPQPIEPGDLTAVLNGLAQARRKEFASDEEVQAAFRRFGG